MHRYANQVFWLTAITPQLGVLLVGFIYTAITQESFAWFESEMFLTGWIIGQIIWRFGYSFFEAKPYISLGIFILGIFILFMVATQFLDSVAWGVA